MHSLPSGHLSGRGVKRASGFEPLQEHPCGEFEYARVCRLPPIGRGPLLPELVVELNAERQVILRWPVPVDHTPEAVRREGLLVAFCTQKFWVRPNGTFTTATVPSIPVGKAMECDLKSIYGEVRLHLHTVPCAPRRSLAQAENHWLSGCVHLTPRTSRVLTAGHQAGLTVRGTFLSAWGLAFHRRVRFGSKVECP
jgi:hypothetical protein